MDFQKNCQSLDKTSAETLEILWKVYNDYLQSRNRRYKSGWTRLNWMKNHGSQGNWFPRNYPRRINFRRQNNECEVMLFETAFHCKLLFMLQNRHWQFLLENAPLHLFQMVTKLPTYYFMFKMLKINRKRKKKNPRTSSSKINICTLVHPKNFLKLVQYFTFWSKKKVQFIIIIW